MERWVTSLHFSNMVEQNREIFHHIEVRSSFQGYPFQGAFLRRFAIPLRCLAAEYKETYAGVRIGVHHYRPAQPQVSFQTRLFQQFPPCCRQDILPAFNMTSDAVVSTRPQAFGWSPFQQQHQRSAPDEDQYPGDEHVTVTRCTLVRVGHKVLLKISP